MAMFSSLESLVISLPSLSNNTSASSVQINNDLAKYKSAIVYVELTVGSSVTPSTGSITFGILRSIDGTNFDSGLLDFNTITTVDNLVSNTTYNYILTTEQLGPLGLSWKLVVQNNTGCPLAASGATFVTNYRGIREENEVIATPLPNAITGIVNVLNTATVIIPADNFRARQGIWLFNAGANTVYLGVTNGVNVSTGFPLPPASHLNFPTSPANVIYGITSSGTSNVNYFIW